MHFFRSKKWRVFLTSVIMAAVLATSALAATKVTAKVNVNLRKSAKTSSKVVTVMKKGATRTVLKTSKNGKWYQVKVNGQKGYVRKTYVEKVSSGNSSSSDSLNQNEGSLNGGTSSGSSFRTNVCSMAKSLLGKPYVYGATGPNSFDCSGFVYWCLNQAGVGVSYMTSSGWRNPGRFRRVSYNELQAGDIIVVSGHVGICAGGGSVIDASSSNGRVVHRSLGPWWANHFIAGWRIFS